MKKKRTEEEIFKKELLADLDYTAARLRQIRESYNMTSEPELVDALIYEELALRSRYDYLVRTAKERNIRCRISISD